MPKDNENYPDLLKVPDEIIIKQLRFELGMCHAEIDELTFNLEQKDTSDYTTIGKKALVRENKSLKIKVDALTGMLYKLNCELERLK